MKLKIILTNCMKKITLSFAVLGLLLVSPCISYAGGNSTYSALGTAFIYGYKNANSSEWIYSAHGNRMKNPIKNLTAKILSKCSSEFSKAALIKECIKGAQTRLNMEYLYIHVNAGA